MFLDSQFRQLIAQEMKLLGLNQTSLADLMGVDQPYVSQYLSGKKSPGDDVKDRFFDALGLEPILSARRIRDVKRLPVDKKMENVA